MAFPFASTILLRESLNIDVELVHQIIGPLLTPERKEKIDRVAEQRNFSNVVVTENIYDRGNISAVMRSAEALGFARIHVIEKGEKFKESQRTTAGSDKWIEMKRWKDSVECLKQMKKEGKRIYATHLSDKAKSISDVDFSVPTALVLGNEKDGISQEVIDLADECVILPMVGFVQSYNISVAAALSFYHIFQDRERKLGHAGDLTATETRILQAVYYTRTLESSEKILSELLERKVIS